MILLKLVDIFEVWIQESITKLLDTFNQSNADNNDVAISEITNDDTNQEINRFFSWSIKVYPIFALRKRSLRNGQQLLKKTISI